MSESERGAPRTWTLKVCEHCGNHETAFRLCEHQREADWTTPERDEVFREVGVVELSHCKQVEAERDRLAQDCPITPSAARVIVRAAENYELRVPAEQGGLDVHEAMDWLRALASSAGPGGRE